MRGFESYGALGAMIFTKKNEAQSRVAYFYSGLYASCVPFGRLISASPGLERWVLRLKIQLGELICIGIRFEKSDGHLS